MSNLTHLQGRNTKVKFVSSLLEKIYVGSETGSESETNWKVGSGSEKIIQDPQHRFNLFLGPGFFPPVLVLIIVSSPSLLLSSSGINWYGPVGVLAHLFVLVSSHSLSSLIESRIFFEDLVLFLSRVVFLIPSNLVCLGHIVSYPVVVWGGLFSNRILRLALSLLSSTQSSPQSEYWLLTHWA
jgi:hypothetical protein